jgi:hypothetical protein
VRIANPELAHVGKRALQIVDIVSASAAPLCNQPRGVLDIEIPGELPVLLVGDEGERAHGSARDTNRDEARQIDVVAHLAAPEGGKDGSLRTTGEPVCHAPARTTATQPHDETRALARAAVPVRVNAQRAVIAVHEPTLPFPVGKSGRPHQRSVAEYP